MRSLIGAPSAMPNADQMLHKVHFMAILTAFGQSFMQPDIMVFKQNLAALEQLNDKWKLYHKVIRYLFNSCGHVVRDFESEAKTRYNF